MFARVRHRNRFVERCNDDLVDLAAASSVCAANLPLLRLGSIQTCRVAFLRRLPWHVRSPPGSSYVLLAAVLLGFPASCRMSGQGAFDKGLPPLVEFDLFRAIAQRCLSRS
jgi:hypothetical protein